MSPFSAAHRVAPAPIVLPDLPARAPSFAPLLPLKFALEFQDKHLVLLHLEATLLNLDLEVDVLFQGGIDLIGGELRETFLEEMNLEFDVEVLLL